MPNPTHIIFKDGSTMTIKAVCVMFNAQKIVWEGKTFEVPATWQDGYERRKTEGYLCE